MVGIAESSRGAVSCLIGSAAFLGELEETLRFCLRRLRGFLRFFF